MYLLDVACIQSNEVLLVHFEMAHDPQSVRLDVSLGEIIFVILHRVCHHVWVTIVNSSNLLISHLLIALNL